MPIYETPQGLRLEELGDYKTAMTQSLPRRRPNSSRQLRYLPSRPSQQR